MKTRLKKHSFLLYCFALAAVFLLIGSKSSPLYPMNDWVDVNCFFTMGKSLLAGKVPYVDLYEQKGPVLYFVYALIALFSPNSYFGVYLLEVLTYGLFLYFSGLIAQLYLGDTLKVYFLVAIEGAIITVTHAFAHGASVEEMGLFMSAYGLFVTLRAIKRGKRLSFREAMVCGIFSGILLWIKYTMLGLYLGLAIFIIIWYLGWGRHWKDLFATIGAFFLGLGLVSAVVAVYFRYHHALEALYTVYFYNNIFLYAKETEGSKLQSLYDCVKHTIRLNTTYTWLFLPGLIWAAVRAVKDIRPLMMLVLTFLGLCLGTYWGGWKISYYGLVLAVYSVFGLIAFGEILKITRLDRLLKKLTFGKTAISVLWVAVLAGMLCQFCLENNRNVYLMGTPKEEMPQYRFAQTINTVEDATLLNYGFLDGGFYYAADVVPNCYFFCLLNVVAPEMFEIQREFINEGKVDFVVTRDRKLSEYPRVDVSRYECVDEVEFYFEGKMRTYYLWQKIVPVG